MKSLEKLNDFGRGVWNGPCFFVSSVGETALNSLGLRVSSEESSDYYSRIPKNFPGVMGAVAATALYLFALGGGIKHYVETIKEGLYQGSRPTMGSPISLQGDLEELGFD